MADHPRPVITVDPAVRFGYPHIKGIPTDAIVDAYLAEEDFAEVADDYGLTVHEMLLVLWFEGMHGRKKRRRILRKWALDAAYPVLSGFDKSKTVEEIALPEVPDRG